MRLWTKKQEELKELVEKLKGSCSEALESVMKKWDEKSENSKGGVISPAPLSQPNLAKFNRIVRFYFFL